MGESRRPHPMQTATKVLERSERDRDIIAGKRRGLTHVEVAEQVGSSVETVRRVLNAAVKDAAANRLTEADLLVTERLEQYGALLNAVWDDAMVGNIKAVNAAIRILDQVSDLTGEKAPVRHEFGESDVDRLLREAIEEHRRRAERADRQAPGVQAHPGLDG
jgi:thioredoxin-like negative regulator of GroEL